MILMKLYVSQHLIHPFPTTGVLNINKMKILITGASGYLGSRFCYYLSQKGHEIIAVCNKNIPTEELWQKSVSQILKGDIRDKFF